MMWWLRSDLWDDQLADTVCRPTEAAAFFHLRRTAQVHDALPAGLSEQHQLVMALERQCKQQYPQVRNVAAWISARVAHIGSCQVQALLDEASAVMAVYLCLYT